MKTIISLTTIPSRINLIEPTIKSILNQSINCEIVLWIPDKINRLNQSFNQIPIFLQKNTTIVKIKDLGSITKIWYALKEYANCNVITIDDDVIYPPTFIENLLKYDDNESVVACRGRVLKKPYIVYNNSVLHTFKQLSKQKNVHIVTGTWGALYKPSFFDSTFFNKKQDGRDFTDDIYISANMWRNQIPIKIIPNFDGDIKPSEYSNLDSLWEINKKGIKNNKSIEFFKNDLLNYKYL